MAVNTTGWISWSWIFLQRPPLDLPLFDFEGENPPLFDALIGLVNF